MKLSDSMHTAHKRHYCDSCGGSIEIGDRYYSQRNIWEGEFHVWKCHEVCAWITKTVNDEGPFSDNRGWEWANISWFDSEEWEWLRQNQTGLHEVFTAYWAAREAAA